MGGRGEPAAGMDECLKPGTADTTDGVGGEGVRAC